MYKPSKHYMDYLQYLIFKKAKQFEGISKFFLSEMTTLGFSSLNALRLATFFKVITSGILLCGVYKVVIWY